MADAILNALALGSIKIIVIGVLWHSTTYNTDQITKLNKS